MRRRMTVVIVIATLALGIVHAPAASADDGDRTRLLRLINATRARHDLHPLRLVPYLSRQAAQHTRRMIRENRIFDPPNLAAILTRFRYDLGAATVACEDTLNRLHRALMGSAVHRGIILNPQLRRVGLGPIRTDETNRCGRGSFWATEIFYG